MKQFIVGLLLGSLLTAGIVFAQHDYQDLSRFEKEQYDRQRLLEYNFNNYIQQQQREHRTPC